MRQVNSDELPYKVESVEIVEETHELCVSVLTLSRGQEVPWHYHNNVTDTFFCLSGTLTIEYGSLQESIELNTGETYQIPAKAAHRVTGTDGNRCRFLIVQGIGHYDFVPIDK